MRKLFELFGVIGLTGIEEVDKKLKGLDSQAKVVNKNLTKIGKATIDLGKTLTTFVTGPIAAVAGGLLFSANSAAKYSDTLIKLAQSTGLSIETLQEHQYIAKQTGVAFESYASVLSTFTLKLGSLQTRGKLAGQALKTLGINALDSNGKVRSLNDLFPQVLQALRDVGDVTQRNILGVKLFGTSFQQLAPIFDLTTAQFRDLIKEAHDIGAVMTEEDVRAAEGYGDAVDKLKEQMMGLWRSIAMQIIPVLKDTFIPIIEAKVIPLVKSLVDIIKNGLGFFRQLPAPIQAGAVALVGLAAALGPIALITGQGILALKGLVTALTTVRLAIIALTAATAANPLGLIAVGATLAATALYTYIRASGAAKDISKKAAEAAQAEVKAREDLLHGIEALRYKLWQHKDILKSESDLTKLLGSDIDSLVESAEKMGYVISGNNTQRKEALLLIAAEIQGLKDASGELIKYNQQSIQASKATIEFTEAESEALNRLLDQQKTLRTEYLTKLDELTEGEIERLKRQEKEAKKYAKSVKASQKDIALITKYYSMLRENYFEGERQKAIDAGKKIESARIEQTQNAFDKFASLQYNKENLLAMQMQKELRAVEGNLEAEYYIRQYYADQFRNLEEQTNLERLESWKKSFRDKLNIAQQTISQVGAIFSEFATNRTIELDNWYQKEKEHIENSKMNEQSKKAAIEKLDKELEAKRRAAARRQAIADKASALFSIVINTAVAVVKALPNVILAAVIGILGAAQAAVVAARPLPLARGGLIKGNRGGVVAEVGESTQDELVLPVKTGVKLLADALFSRLSDMRSSIVSAMTPPLSAAYPTGAYNTEQHFHIGVLVADDRGLKELERRMLPFRTLEAQRRGES